VHARALTVAPERAARNALGDKRSRVSAGVPGVIAIVCAEPVVVLPTASAAATPTL